MTFRKSIVLFLSVLFLFSLCNPASAEEPERVSVSSAEEFLAAIRNDATIVMEPGTYDLTAVSDYGSSVSPYYRWASDNSAYSLTVTGVSNLTIIGSPETVLIAPCSGTGLLAFENCSGISLNYLTFAREECGTVSNGTLLSFLLCSDVSAAHCSFLGGFSGLRLELSHRVHFSDSSFSGCKAGAVLAHESGEIVLEECNVTSCSSTTEDLSEDLFRFVRCSDTAVINSDISGNTALTMFRLSDSDFYLGGCSIHDNRVIQSVYSIDTIAPVIDSCDFFGNNSNRWYSSTTELLPRDAVGNAISYGSTYTNMVRSHVDLPLMESARSESADVPADAIRVSTVDEFLAALGSNRTIYVEPGCYNLSDSELTLSSSRSCFWKECYDGYELYLSGIDRLNIVGAGRSKVLFLVHPRYANVLNMEFCSNISLSGITFGHVPNGYCTGGVLHFDHTGPVAIRDCGMFGCGTYGILASGCHNMTVDNSEIYDCSYGAMSIEYSSYMYYNDLTIRNCAYPAISLYATENIFFNDRSLDSRAWDISPSGELTPEAFG